MGYDEWIEDYYIYWRVKGEDKHHAEFIPPGYYKTVNQLCMEINERIYQRIGEKDHVTLKYHESTRQVYVKTNGDYAVTFSRALGEMLGFESNFLRDHGMYTFPWENIKLI